MFSGYPIGQCQSLKKVLLDNISVDEWFSIEIDFALHGTYGNVWRHIWLSQLREEGCY